MENKFNVEVCSATNVECSYCQPVCGHRLLCDKCNVKTCGANFNGWCRQPYLMCWVRKDVLGYAEEYRERVKAKSNKC